MQWAVLRLIATQSILYCAVLIVLAISLLPNNTSVSSSAVNILSYFPSVFIGSILVLLYHLPTPQVAILEPRSYGFRGVYRAMELAYSKLLTSLGLAFFSVSYFCLLKLLVDVLLRDSYPFWTKFLAYPPLVISVIAMSIFWQVVYTLLYLSTIQVDLDKLEPDMESRSQAADINHPLLVSNSMLIASCSYSSMLLYEKFHVLERQTTFDRLFIHDGLQISIMILTPK